MNNFFCSIGKELADKIDSVPKPLLTGEYEINANKAKFNFRTIKVKEVRAAFAKIKTTKSFGIDNISSYFLKPALPFIENSLALLFNTSIGTSQFPDSWKVARVTPIFKMETRLKSQTTVRYQSYPSFQGSLKNLFLTSCISI